MSILSSLIPLLQADASLNGIMYSITLADKTITADNYEAFMFTNPSASNVAIQFNTITGTSDQMIDIDVIKEATAFTSTSSITPRNNDSGASDSSVLTNVSNADNVSTNPVTGDIILYSYRNQMTYNIYFAGAITVQAGHNVAFNIKNSSSSDAKITFNFNWWEINFS